MAELFSRALTEYKLLKFYLATPHMRRLAVGKLMSPQYASKLAYFYRSIKLNSVISAELLWHVGG